MTQAETIQSVEVEVRLLAGMIGKSELSVTRRIVIRINRSGAGQQLALVPDEELVALVRRRLHCNYRIVHENELPPVTTLSSLNPSGG